MRRLRSSASALACCSAARRSARSDEIYENSVTAERGTTEMAKKAAVKRERSVIPLSSSAGTIVIDAQRRE
jgi:hypothetical protein